jgi:hypothetical protein
MYLFYFKNLKRRTFDGPETLLFGMATKLKPERKFMRTGRGIIEF